MEETVEALESKVKVAELKARLVLLERVREMAERSAKDGNSNPDSFGFGGMIQLAKAVLR